MQKLKLISLTLIFLASISGCSSSGISAPDPNPMSSQASPENPQSPSPSSSMESAAPNQASNQTSESDSTAKNYFGNFSLSDSEFGTITKALVTSTTRTITTNALPNHKTGTFPNSGNPNTIQAQNRTWVLPAEINYTGVAKTVRETGVALNGVKFEPGTAEVATCAGGERHPIEGLQKVADLGMDFNNAHVQPNGEYHYHGKSELLVKIFELTNSDLVHIGFAQDGATIYYSKSGKYSSSYSLGNGSRTGENCTYTAGKRGTISFGTSKDGSLTTDWDYKKGQGVLDECNGVVIGGKYSYLITDEYPFIPRCLKGEFSERSR